jgi:hypothetical protein
MSVQHQQEPGWIVVVDGPSSQRTIQHFIETRVLEHGFDTEFARDPRAASRIGASTVVFLYSRESHELHGPFRSIEQRTAYGFDNKRSLRLTVRAWDSTKSSAVVRIDELARFVSGSITQDVVSECMHRFGFRTAGGLSGPGGPQPQPQSQPPPQSQPQPSTQQQQQQYQIEPIPHGFSTFAPAFQVGASTQRALQPPMHGFAPPPQMARSAQRMAQHHGQQQQQLQQQLQQQQQQRPGMQSGFGRGVGADGGFDDPRGAGGGASSFSGYQQPPLGQHAQPPQQLNTAFGGMGGGIGGGMGGGGFDDRMGGGMNSMGGGGVSGGGMGGGDVDGN